MRRQVAEDIEVFRNGGGYTVAACHQIQSNTPAENSVARCNAVREFGG